MKAAAFIVLLFLGSAIAQPPPYDPAAVSAMFVFGDSLVDSGNNNYLNTRAKCNHPPYGLNFPNKTPTGRFTDGKLVVDFIAEKLGLPLIPPYYGAGNNITKGVNFGSGSSGIFDETHMDGAVPMRQQLLNFRDISAKLNNLLEIDATAFISRSIFFIEVGNNDVNNYYRTHQRPYEMDIFTQTRLVNSLRDQLKFLYNLGAQKFVVVQVSAVGCVPMNQDEDGECSDAAQMMSATVNNAIDEMIADLRDELSGATIVQPNFYGLMIEVHDAVKARPGAFGMWNSKLGCCGTTSGPRASLQCDPSTIRCNNPDNFMFWDGVHPTQKFNKIAADRWWNGTVADIRPINIRELAAI